jgi:methyl-accepting chemotaxis protein
LSSYLNQIKELKTKKEEEYFMTTSVDFNVAIIKHRAWKINVRGFLDGKQSLSESEVVSHRDCDLGKWLYSNGLHDYGNIPQMKELEQVHTSLHNTIRKVVQLKNSGKSHAAEEEFENLANSSERIISLLKLVDSKVN